MNYLNSILPLLHIHENYLNEKICDEIVEYAEKRPNIFRDRSKEYIKYGIDGEIGNYYAAEIDNRSLIPLWEKYFKNLEFDGLTPTEVQLNKYSEGSFIPPHKDEGIAFHTISIPLQTNNDNYLIFGESEVYSEGINIDKAEKEGKIKVFRDKKGYGYRFEGTQPIHWVPPVKSNRYSLVVIF